jgi:hypothetical protein
VSAAFFIFAALCGLVAFGVISFNRRAKRLVFLSNLFMTTSREALAALLDEDEDPMRQYTALLDWEGARAALAAIPMSQQLHVGRMMKSVGFDGVEFARAITSLREEIEERNADLDNDLAAMVADARSEARSVGQSASR